MELKQTYPGSELDTKEETWIPLENLFCSKGRVRIIILLQKEKELSITQICNELNYNNPSVRKHLDVLMGAGIVQEKCFNVNKVYRWKEEAPVVSVISNFLMEYSRNGS